MSVVLLLLLGVLGFLSQLVMGQFVPSASWVAGTFWLAFVISAVTAVLPTIVIIRGMKRVGPSNSSIHYLFVLVLFPLIYGLLGFSTVLFGGPQVYTAVFGGPIETLYKVRRTTFDVPKCGNMIELIVPPINDRLCGFPKDFTDTLRPGQSVIVSGKGSPVGIFVDSVRLSNQP